jgi:hypothetical protein
MLRFTSCAAIAILSSCAHAGKTTPSGLPSWFDVMVQDAHRRAATPALQISPAAQHGLRTIRTFIQLARDPKTYAEGNGELYGSLSSAIITMGFMGGYDFKWDVDGWEYWYEWLSRRDPGIALKCLEDGSSNHLLFGLSIALSSGNADLIQKYLDGYSKLDQMAQYEESWWIANWSRDSRVREAQLNPDERTWELFNSDMKDIESLWLKQLSR